MAALPDTFAYLVINALDLPMQIAADAFLSHREISSGFFGGMSLDTQYLFNNEPDLYAGDPNNFPAVYERCALYGHPVEKVMTSRPSV
jgi:hypothetical protein